VSAGCRDGDMKESTLVDQIRKALKAQGVKTLKIHGSQYMPAGEPDLIGCKDGQFYCWEVKVGKNGPTPLQLKRLEEWREAGAVASVVWSVDEAIGTLG
jgi:Holliday junction resolvase